MKFLLDSCVVIWWTIQPVRLSNTFNDLLETNPFLLLSPATGYEISFKENLGKITFDIPFRSMYDTLLNYPNVEELPITFEHSLLAGELPITHKDPFDRLLAAQAISEGVPIVTPDQSFKALGAEVFW